VLDALHQLLTKRSSIFGVREALAVLRRAERGGAATEELTRADWMLEARPASALVQTGLDVPPDTPLAALAGGQRTRASLAALVLADSDFLLLANRQAISIAMVVPPCVICWLASWCHCGQP
jgi:ATPase subunit of ABC transporter with duplicated ATPase domains